MFKLSFYVQLFRFIAGYAISAVYALVKYSIKNPLASNNFLSMLFCSKEIKPFKQNLARKENVAFVRTISYI